MSKLHDRLEAAYDYARRQLTENSTVRGLIIVLGSGTVLEGWLSPDKFVIVMMLAGIVGLVLPDDLPEWMHLPEWPWKRKQ